jgi:hypothetical protein
MATNQHATTEELLEAVFSVVRSAAVATQRRSKHVFSATVELQQRCFLRSSCQGGINGTNLEAGIVAHQIFSNLKLPDF